MEHCQLAICAPVTPPKKPPASNKIGHSRNLQNNRKLTAGLELRSRAKKTLTYATHERIFLT